MDHRINFSDMRGEFGFSKVSTAEKQYLRSGLRPENPGIFSNPQIFDESVKKAFLTHKAGDLCLRLYDS